MHSFLKLIFILSTLLMLPKGELVYESKPNFIIYISDDQDYLDYGIYGNDRARSL